MTTSNGVLTLATTDDVVEASRLAGWFHRPEFADVRVSMVGIPPGDSAKAARAVRSLFNDCACAWGGATFLVVIVAAWFLPILADAAVWVRAAGILFLALAASLAAKGLGLALSRWRLLLVLEQLRAAAIDVGESGVTSDHREQRI